MTEITALLIANRGEIARRIIRTAHEMGLRTIAVYSEVDNDAPHVREADLAVPLTGASAAESYLDQQQILHAARSTGADAIHPGYGFLAENAAFAEACLEASLTWIGPPPEAIRKMGLKVEAKELARSAGVPVAPDALVSSDDATTWETAAASVGYPLLVKASAGGGGKGMRLVNRVEDLAHAIAGARREARNSFGDATVFLERYLPAPRHVEIQVFADTQGNVIHLYERECSIQRRYQKVIEEAPSPGMTPALRTRMCEASLALTRAIGYVGAGTIEYLVDGEQFYFLEMNTRLQVEHPVTECITRLDLVRLQIQVARGEALPEQETISCQGHAIEVRLYAEDPRAGFLPAFGSLVCFEPGKTPGIRYDAGVESGSQVTTHYDPMLAKVISSAPTRLEAASRLARALREMRVQGVRTNRDFLAATLTHSAFLAGETHTDFVNKYPALLHARPDEATRDAHLLACVAVLARRRRLAAPVQSSLPGGWRNVRSAGQRMTLGTDDDSVFEIEYVLDTQRSPLSLTLKLEERTLQAEFLSLHAEGARLVFAGIHYTCHVNCVQHTVYVNSADGQSEFSEMPRFTEPEMTTNAGGPTSQLPGSVSAVMVSSGDRVKAGQTLVVLEAMKMEHTITAIADSVIEKVLVKTGDKVDAHQLLVVLTPTPDRPGESPV